MVKGLATLIFSTTTAAFDGGSVVTAGVVGVVSVGEDGGVGFGGFNGAEDGCGVELRWRREARRRREEEEEEEGWGRSKGGGEIRLRVVGIDNIGEDAYEEVEKVLKERKR